MAFRVSRLHRLWGIAVFVLVGFLFGALAPFLAWGVIGHITIWKSPPVWWSLVCAMGSIGILTGFWLLARRSLTKQLVVTEHGVRFDTAARRRLIAYEEISLVRLVHDPNAIGRSMQLVIEDMKWRANPIWLASDDAAECFQSLQVLCHRAAAMQGGEVVKLPDQAADLAIAHDAVAVRLRRQAREAFAVAIVFGSVWLIVIVGLIRASYLPPWPLRLLLALLFIAANGAAGGGALLRRRATAHRKDADMLRSGAAQS